MTLASAEVHPLWTDPPRSSGTGPGHTPTLTAYPADIVDGPAMIVIPGGRYAHISEREGEPVARWLNGIGVHAFVLRYRVDPYRYPVPLLDAARAVRFVRHHARRFGLDPRRVGVLGFSAGGHLAGLLATGAAPQAPAGDDVDLASPHPAVAVLGYPITSLTDHPHLPANGHLLGPHPQPGLLDELSLPNRVGPAGPPMFLWHTSDDPSVDVRHSLLLARSLAERHRDFELHVYPQGAHGLGLAEGHPAAAWTAACAAYLRRQGW